MGIAEEVGHVGGAAGSSRRSSAFPRKPDKLATNRAVRSTGRSSSVLRLGTTVATLATVMCSAPASPGTPPPGDPAPPGVEILLPRGGIPAVFEPAYVRAADSGLPDSAWVLGVALGRESHAFSLNLLNGHEVVNDVLGKHPIAAVW